MTVYKWTPNGFVDPDGKPMELPTEWTPSMPMVIRDIDPYESPATGKWITSRSEAREDLKASGCRILEPEENPTGQKPGELRLRNKKFAEKRGLKVHDDFRDYDSSTKQKAQESA